MKQIFKILVYYHERQMTVGCLSADSLFSVGSDIRNLKIVEYPFFLNDFCLPFASPELITGSYDKEIVDVWSAGVLMYLYLTGKTPFYDDQLVQYAHNILDMKYDASGLSKNSADLLSKIFVPFRERLSAKECLEHPWFDEVWEEARWVFLGMREEDCLFSKLPQDICFEIIRNI
eukprot:TRINITY_DN4664_c0_g1_i1.p1 TRINITY_DN4664_c0_g1~~TRINITY_DN4664_c0_g1_i1.p1  ORF type:complete len:175 (+),score=36.10 TRINITY_DN4664_c0_g1_i1:775-1299(+)